MSELKINHYVYVIGTVAPSGGLTGPVKIGVTSNPDARLASLQTGSSTKIEIAAVFEFPTREIAVSVERAFHSVKKRDQAIGEWFNMGPICAVGAMCKNVMAMLSHHIGLTGDLLHASYYLSGAWHAEKKVMAERYRNAWETP